MKMPFDYYTLEAITALQHSLTDLHMLRLGENAHEHMHTLKKHGIATLWATLSYTEKETFILICKDVISSSSQFDI